MLKKRIFALCFILLLLVVGFFFKAVQQSKAPHRDVHVLMDLYYQLRQSDPDGAEKALSIVLRQNPNDLPALIESSQWLLHQHDLIRARPLLERLHALLPENNTYAFQLAHVYYDEGDWQRARAIFLLLNQAGSRPVRIEAEAALNAMASYVPVYTDYTHIKYRTIRSDGAIASAYSKLSSTPSVSPIRPLQKKTIIQKTDAEKGYMALARGHRIEAIDYFTRAYSVTKSPNIAMQLAYLYDQLNDKPRAYQYFKLATQSPDQAQSLRAQVAMTNLGGLQTKALPAPYFSEIFFTPFTQSRFDLTVRPLIVRAGVEQDNRLKTKEYVFLRRTDDNRSESLGQVSQIYEDDVQITGVGAQATPFPTIPLVGFVEAGTAYDLVYRDRNRWRGDLRAGLMYYQNVGCKPGYYDQLKASTDYYGEWYADMIYFSRYQNNVIGGAVTRQGIRALQYKSSILNVYVVGRALSDTQRVFYNNFAEIGPGVSFMPSNRFNLQLRFEHLNGMYIPAGSIPNPYAKYYTNNVVQLLVYVKI
jgi:tetratricopeptide (TPR) repeat protein